MFGIASYVGFVVLACNDWISAITLWVQFIGSLHVSCLVTQSDINQSVYAWHPVPFLLYRLAWLL